MSDLTLLYYTSSRVEEFLGDNVRKHLLGVNDGEHPIISVSQKPLDFGKNICVGEIGASYYNCYKQIYLGALQVETKYVAMCEDDTLYSKEHFANRPQHDDAFAFNRNMWYAEEMGFWNRGWVGMCTCITTKEALLANLKPRFDMYPEESMVKDQKDFQEPGIRDDKFGLSPAKREYFSTDTPILTFNFFRSLGGKKWSWKFPPVVTQDLEPWGNCFDLKKQFWGRARKISREPMWKK